MRYLSQSTDEILSNLVYHGAVIIWHGATILSEEYLQRVQFYRSRLLQRQKSKLQEERKRSRTLLQNILPDDVIRQVSVGWLLFPHPLAMFALQCYHFLLQMQRGEALIARTFPEVTVMFTDMVQFTKFSTQLTPTQTLAFLNAMFSVFDKLTTIFDIHKVCCCGEVLRR